jgi:hypothetical protein
MRLGGCNVAYTVRMPEAKEDWAFHIENSRVWLASLPAFFHCNGEEFWGWPHPLNNAKSRVYSVSRCFKCKCSDLTVEKKLVDW